MTTQTNPEVELTAEMISPRAYQRYLDRGRQGGHDVEDWLAAEEELRTATPPSKTNSSPRTPRTRKITKATPRR